MCYIHDSLVIVRSSSFRLVLDGAQIFSNFVVGLIVRVVLIQACVDNILHLQLFKLFLQFALLGFMIVTFVLGAVQIRFYYYDYDNDYDYDYDYDDCYYNYDYY